MYLPHDTHTHTHTDNMGAYNGQKDREEHDPAEDGDPPQTAAVQPGGEEGQVCTKSSMATLASSQGVA